MAYSDFTSLDGRARTARPAIPVGNFSLLSGHHYNPDQPRVPAGQSGGGQWTSEGGDSAVIGAAPHQASVSTSVSEARGPKPNTDATLDEGRIVSDALPGDTWRPGARYAGGEIREVPVGSSPIISQASDPGPMGEAHRGYSPTPKCSR